MDHCAETMKFLFDEDIDSSRSCSPTYEDYLYGSDQVNISEDDSVHPDLIQREYGIAESGSDVIMIVDSPLPSVVDSPLPSVVDCTIEDCLSYSNSDDETRQADTRTQHVLMEQHHIEDEFQIPLWLSSGKKEFKKGKQMKLTQFY